MNTENFIKINVPEGMMIDAEKSSFEQIFFKPIPPKKPTWEDFGIVVGYYISSDSDVRPCNVNESNNEVKNTWPTKEQAEAALALSQLCQWMNKYNEGWKPDWNDTKQMKYIILSTSGKIDCGYNNTTMERTLAFKTAEIRKKFAEDFKELLEIAKPLL